MPAKTLIEEYGLVEEFLRLRKEGQSYEQIYSKWQQERSDLPRIPSISAMSRFELNYDGVLLNSEPNRYNTMDYTIGNAEFLTKTNQFLIDITTAADRQELNGLISKWRMELKKFLGAYALKQKVTKQVIYDWTNEVMDKLPHQECINICHEKARELLDRFKVLED